MDRNLKNAERKRASLEGLLLIIVALLTLEATSLVQFYYAQKGLREEARLRAESQLEAVESQMVGIMTNVETAVRNNVWYIREHLSRPDGIAEIPARLVQENDLIAGSTFATTPGYYPKRPLFAPYVFRERADSLRRVSLATPEYDYPSQEWFTRPLEVNDGWWSEPYFDEGGGGVMMTTYSLPVADEAGVTAGVLTADITLDWLTDLVGSVRVYPNARSLLLSRKGLIMVSPNEKLSMSTMVEAARQEMDKPDEIRSVDQAMLAGKRGSAVVTQNKTRYHVFYEPVERAGWSVALLVPEREIFSGLRRVAMMVGILQLLGLAMLIMLIQTAVHNRDRLRAVSEKKERIENELHIARGIQMAMLPKTFPPFPERSEIDMYASLQPAKEVGGDLYDFFIRDEKLFFCIGDVSGKGVPASLVMAVTRSLFRTLSSHESSPQRIVTRLNDALADMNESNMFVTFYLGILDLSNGHLRYCNAGHNAPQLVTPEPAKPLPVIPNLPLGVMPGVDYIEQKARLRNGEGIFLYTDGLTEAEDLTHALFGEERLQACLDASLGAQKQAAAIIESIGRHVGDAEQSDDLTMLYIRYTNPRSQDIAERHLILHNDIQQIPQLAEFMEQIAREAKLDQSLSMSLNLALEEAVTNVILYAYPEGSDGLVDIEAIIRPERLDFIISDSGIPFDPTAAPEADVTLSAEERPIGGLGIYLVRNLMDTVTYRREHDRNILAMTKQIK